MIPRYFHTPHPELVKSATVATFCGEGIFDTTDRNVVIAAVLVTTPVGLPFAITQLFALKPSATGSESPRHI